MVQAVRAEVRRLPPRESCVPESGRGQVVQRGHGKGSPCLAALQDVTGEGPPLSLAGSQELGAALGPATLWQGTVVPGQQLAHSGAEPGASSPF